MATVMRLKRVGAKKAPIYRIIITDTRNKRDGRSIEVVGVYNPLTEPATVELKIEQTDPGVKGNSATGRTKPATLETGCTIQVPEYLKEGETIKVDTPTHEFLGRA